MGITKKRKVVGIGLNKTATKSLAQCLEALGYRNQSYSLQAFKGYQVRDWPALFACMEEHDSFEDWPWPLMYRDIDKHYPDARFILTIRHSPEIWYRSLCKMAVRMGPLNDFEKHIYGYSMPQAAREAHISFYEQHNAEVRSYFADRPDKLLELCFDDGIDMLTLCRFLNEPVIDMPTPHVNRSAMVYSGDSLWIAHLNRIVFQASWQAVNAARQLRRRAQHLP